MVRAKFRCDRIVRSEYQSAENANYEVFFHPVYGDSPENKKWSKATPSGELRMSITNPDAQVFIAGKEYFLDIALVS